MSVVAEELWVKELFWFWLVICIGSLFLLIKVGVRNENINGKQSKCISLGEYHSAILISDG